MAQRTYIAVGRLSMMLFGWSMVLCLAGLCFSQEHRVSPPVVSEFLTVDYPGAAASFGAGVNRFGKVAGYFWANGHLHGFMENYGNYRQFDLPGEGTFTALYGMNDNGDVVGSYGHPFALHSFVYSSTAGLSTFDYPGSRRSYANAINTAGDIVGAYFNFGEAYPHGYLLHSGTFTSIDVPGVIFTIPSGINAAGTIVGDYRDMSNILHGFVLENGTYTTVDYPGATESAVVGVNSSGTMVGEYIVNGESHGFTYSQGSFAAFDFPGVSATFPSSISDSEMITGFYIDGTGQYHGFVAK